MKAYKGFNKDMTCRGFQYEEGKEYEHEGNIKCCENGFHACKAPMDCFNYYNLNESEFHEVELDGYIDEENQDDTKVSASKIKIGAKISIAGIVKAQIAFIKEKVVKTKSATSGDYSTSATSGNASISASSGNASTSATSGYKSISATLGDYSTSATSGNASISATSGYKSTSATSGYKSISATLGDYSTSATSGYESTSATLGNASTSASSGYASISATSGYKSTSASSGDYSTSATSGNASISASSGYKSSAIANDQECIAVAFGYKSRAKGCLGSHIVISEWEYDGNEDSKYETFEYRNDKEHWHLKEVKLFKVDGEIIKENTWYALKNGQPTEVESEEWLNGK